MENKSPIKEFYCKIHKTKPITHVCFESTASACLFCDDCSDLSTNPQLLEFEDYINKVVEHYSTYGNIFENNELEELPLEFQEFIERKKENVKIKEHDKA